MLRNRKSLKLIVGLVVGLWLSLFIFWGLAGSVWTKWDYQLLDSFYQLAVKLGRGPTTSREIVYLYITDKTYEYFGKNILDRRDLARVNDALTELAPQAIAYDIIFARPSHSAADQRFEESIQNLGNVYLPVGFEVSDRARPFKWEPGEAYQRFASDFLSRPTETGIGRPFYAARALMQADGFAQVAANSGHISASSDADGVYRHAIMIVKVDSLYFPTLSLAMFLDYVGASLDDVAVEWGKSIRIPAAKASFLDVDLEIPIDGRGRTFIPYPQVWGKDFQQMAVHSFLQLCQDENLHGNLREFLEGKFVFIGDISSGTSDLGQTPLAEEAPLITTHTALLNGLLTRTFYQRWSSGRTIVFILIIGTVLGLSAAVRSPYVQYSVGAIVASVVLVLTWLQMTNQVLVPVTTLSASSLYIFFGLTVGLQVAISKEQSFIRNAFSRYVPESVVKELLEKPELLQLGGEERELTVLFADLQGFTSLSETMPPKELVKLLNEYFTEMVDIIIDEGGIIDKFEGDAVMAEFGIPIPASDHADRAVRAALKMQQRIHDLQSTWSRNGWAELRCRIGINTGTMVVGNMGSHQAFDYTVIGDAVNLAARLEAINKRFGTSLLISEFTYAQLTAGSFRTRFLGEVQVEGKLRRVRVFEVLSSEKQ